MATVSSSSPSLADTLSGIVQLEHSHTAACTSTSGAGRTRQQLHATGLHVDYCIHVQHACAMHVLRDASTCTPTYSLRTRTVYSPYSYMRMHMYIRTYTPAAAMCTCSCRGHAPLQPRPPEYGPSPIQPTCDSVSKQSLSPFGPLALGRGTRSRLVLWSRCKRTVCGFPVKVKGQLIEDWERD